MATIKLNTNDGVLDFEADLFGQCAVVSGAEAYRVLGDEGCTIPATSGIVCDIGSKQVIACFNPYHVAVNLARRLDAEYDMTYLDDVTCQTIMRLIEHPARLIMRYGNGATH